MIGKYCAGFLPVSCQRQECSDLAEVCWITSQSPVTRKDSPGLGSTRPGRRWVQLSWLQVWPSGRSSIPRHLSVSRAESPAREVVFLGSTWRHLTKICLGFGSGPQSVIATALEECDLADFVSMEGFVATQLLWFYRRF